MFFDGIQSLYPPPHESCTMDARTTLQLDQVGVGYGRNTVYRDLSIGFAGGRTALLGPNGAGKSTMLAAIAGALPVSNGQISLTVESPIQTGAEYERSGDATAAPRLSPSDRRTRKQFLAAVAWAPQATRPYSGLRVKEYVALAGWLKGMPKSRAWDAADQALQLVDLADFSQRPSKALSGGQLRRLGIAAALVHDAKVMLFDEPTAGLDPLQRDQFHEVLARLPADVVTICSTHLLDEVSEIYDSLVIVDRGRVVLQHSVDDLLADFPGSSRAAALRAVYEQHVGREQ